MIKFLEYSLLDNTIKSYLLVVVIILFVVLLKRKISKYSAGLLYRIFGDSSKKIKKQAFIDLVVHPLEFFLILIVSFIALDKLNFPKNFEFKVFRFSSKQIIESLSTALLIISFIWLCIRSIDFIAFVLREKANVEKDAAESQIIVFFKDFFKVIVVIVGILILLHFAFNRDIGNIFTSLSIVAAAIALATRESLENLIASFIIFFDKPFTVGDVVKVNQFTGTVEKIGLRSTRIRTEIKTYITVPNKQMVDTVVDNLSLRSQRKIEMKIEVDLKTNVTTLTAFVSDIKKILYAQKEVETYNVFLSDIGKNYHTITYDFETSSLISLLEFNTIKEQINFSILSKADELAINFAATSNLV